MSEDVPMNNAYNSSSTNRGIWIAIIILGIINVGMAIMMWGPMPFMRPPHPGECPPPQRPDGPPPPDGRQPPGGAEPFAFLVRTLGMDEAQQQKFRELRDAHREAMQPLRSVLRDARRAMFSHVPDAGEATLQADLLAAGMAQRSIDSITVLHFRKVRALLRPDQQSKFDEVIGELPKMMGGAPPPPPPPPHGEPR